MARLSMKPLLLGAVLLAAVAGTPAQAGDVPLVTGEHWTKASDSEKKAFLVGVANVVSVEYELRKDDRRSRPGMISALVTNLQPLTLTEISKGVDDYYAAHPDQTARSVISVIVTDVAKVQPRKK